MTDWSDEVRARLVREEERLRYKAANLQARGKTVMAAQELVVADDIRAALGEIRRLRGVLGLVLTETGLQAHKHGCPERLRRPAQWDQTLPCAGCAAEAALSTEEEL